MAEHTPEHPRSTSAYADAGRRDRFDADTATATDMGHGSGHDSGHGNDKGHEQGKGHQ